MPVEVGELSESKAQLGCGSPDPGSSKQCVYRFGSVRMKLTKCQRSVSESRLPNAGIGFFPVVIFQKRDPSGSVASFGSESLAG